MNFLFALVSSSIMRRFSNKLSLCFFSVDSIIRCFNIWLLCFLMVHALIYYYLKIITRIFKSIASEDYIERTQMQYFFTWMTIFHKIEKLILIKLRNIYINVVWLLIYINNIWGCLHESFPIIELHWWKYNQLNYELANLLLLFLIYVISGFSLPLLAWLILLKSFSY